MQKHLGLAMWVLLKLMKKCDKRGFLYSFLSKFFNFHFRSFLKRYFNSVLSCSTTLPQIPKNTYWFRIWILLRISFVSVEWAAASLLSVFIMNSDWSLQTQMLWIPNSFLSCAASGSYANTLGKPDRPGKKVPTNKHMDTRRM